MKPKPWRLKKGLYQSHIGEELGKSRSTVSQLERGRQWPSQAVIEAYQRFSGGEVTIDDWMALAKEGN